MKTGIIAVLSMLMGAAAGASAVGKAKGDELRKAKELSSKHLDLFLLMNQWVKVKQEGKNLSLYFERNGYKKIAVYGMSYAGETLVNELKDSNTEVVYGIDQRADSLYADIDIVSMDEPLSEVDAVVVTSITFFEEVEEKLSGRLGCPIISLEDVLHEV